MKQENYYLHNENIRLNLLNRISELDCNGLLKVAISNSAKKSDKQRGLMWIWYKDVEEAGTESAHTISVSSKIAFGLTIAMANQEKYKDFIELYWTVNKAHGEDDNFMFYFFDKHFHTEWFDTNEMAQFLTHFEIHYSRLGVELSDPIDWKLLNR